MCAQGRQSIITGSLMSLLNVCSPPPLLLVFDKEDCCGGSYMAENPVIPVARSLRSCLRPHPEHCPARRSFCADGTEVWLLIRQLFVAAAAFAARHATLSFCLHPLQQWCSSRLLAQHRDDIHFLGQERSSHPRTSLLFLELLPLLLTFQVEQKLHLHQHDRHLRHFLAKNPLPPYCNSLPLLCSSTSLCSCQSDNLLPTS